MGVLAFGLGSLAGICLRTLQLMIARALVSASRSQISFAPLLRLNVHRQEPCRNYKYFSSFRPLQHPVSAWCARKGVRRVRVGSARKGVHGRVRAGCARSGGGRGVRGGCARCLGERAGLCAGGVRGVCAGVCAGVCVGVCVGVRGRVCAEGCARGVRGLRWVPTGCASKGACGVRARCAQGARGVCAGVGGVRAGCARCVLGGVRRGVRGDLRGACARYPRKGASHVLHTEVSAVLRCPLPTAFSAGRSQHYP